MFEKVSQLAEQAATNVSRREFLGGVGRSALVVAAAAGGMLALPAAARAARRSRLCSANSYGQCAGLPEGSSCSAERASGRCVGRTHNGVTDCYCDVKVPR